MIYTKTGAGITVDGIFYFVGMYVHANNTSDYAGLYGVVTEIRTDDDRETENDTPDIYCQFDAPVLPCEVSELETRFSALYGLPMKLNDISLDMVVMAPDMLEPSIIPVSTDSVTQVWAVIEDWADDYESSHRETLFVSYNDACAVFHSQLSAEAIEGYISRWYERDDFELETSETVYECWLEGEYIGYHYMIAIEPKPLVCQFSPMEESK